MTKPENIADNLAADLLWGCKAIAAAIGAEPRSVCY